MINQEYFEKQMKQLVDNNNFNTVSILNWYRNAYFREPNTTERGIVAYEINNVFAFLNEKGYMEELKEYIKGE